MKVINLKQEEQLLKPVDGKNELMKTHCETTGIYYFIVYAKEGMNQNATLKLFYDEQSRNNLN